MQRPRIHSLCWLAILLVQGTCISLLEVLQSQPELSTLYGYINASTNGTSLLTSANNFTFIAPSNTALANLLASNPSALTKDAIDATLQYSLLNGGYPSLSFTNKSQFVTTNLNNATYANVTGGQRAELVMGSNGEPNIITGNQSISQTSSVLVCVGGFVHIVDTVPTIPLTTVLELTAANLEFFTSILNVGGYLNEPNIDYVNGVLALENVTYFIPNSAEALANATATIQANGSAAALQALFEYHIVPNSLGYSSALTNGTTLKTSEGEDITITIQDGVMFVNDAKVITKDLLVANGVAHVIDSLLNRFDKSGPPPPVSSSTTTSGSPASTANSTPTSNAGALSTPSDNSSSQSGGLSTGAKAGIGVGAAVGGLALIAVAIIAVLRIRTQRDSRGMSDRRSMSTGGTPDMGKTVGMHEYHGHGEQMMGTTTSVSGPNIPPRSPNRDVRGGGDNYF